MTCSKKISTTPKGKYVCHQDHADKADDEVVGEADQPGGDEVVDRAPPTAPQPGHVTRLRDQHFTVTTSFAATFVPLAFISAGKNVWRKYPTIPTSRI